MPCWKTFSFWTGRELDPRNLQDKEVRLDILGWSNDGTLVNVEVHVDSFSWMTKRLLLYYWGMPLCQRVSWKDGKADVARNLLHLGMPIAQLSATTGFFAAQNDVLRSVQ